MRILLLRPPRYVWPFNSETSAFWQPLGLLCLAAAARREVPGATVEVWDAPAERCGWKTLDARLRAERIDVLGIGEETVSAHEAIRAAQIVKEAHPESLVVAGGTYFAHAVESSLGSGCVDVVVRGEGEMTFVELLKHARYRGAWTGIAGLAFLDGEGRVHRTPPRRLIARLDDLPFPAYDLLKMNLYGRGSRNHPGLVSIEHSRGCIDSCDFCILWKQMGQSVNGNGQYRPCYRTKSAERSFEEVRWLYRSMGRRTFGWVDPTFNASEAWSAEWAERMLRSELMDGRGRARTIHTAWVRADCLVRDHRSGVLAALVRAGLRQVMIGVERDDAAGLAALGKHRQTHEVCREAFALIREHYPEVYTIGTMIFGLPSDTAADLRRLMRCQYDLEMDYCFLMPLTPNPGTGVAQEARAAGRIANGDLASYNFHTPVCRTESMGLRELEATYWRLMFQPDARRLEWFVKQLLLQRDRRKQRIHWALFKRGCEIAVRSLGRRLTRPNHPQPALYSRKPSWYDT